MDTQRHEWLKWRKGGIGSSDAPIIMGTSPWSTPLKLYEEKISEEVTEDTSNQYIKDKGNRFEPKIRSMFELIKGCDFSAALVQMAEYPFMRASLDGRNEKNEIIEIKLLGQADWDAAKHKKMIPVKYEAQIQHQLFVSGSPICYFLGFVDSDNGLMLQENLVVVEVFPDKNYQLKLLEKCVGFWDCVQKRKPPVPSDKDYKQLKGLAKQANKWKQTKLKLEKLGMELEILKDQIIEAAEKAGHPRLICSGIKISQISKVGSVDYGKIPELKNVDLEKYRKNGSTYWKMEA